ncbi:hypothetical protein [Bradyrhizobium sp. USDA 10063]
MKKLSGLAAATAALMLMSCSGYALAQTAPAAGTDATAPAADTAPPPAATTAPAATTTPAATQPDTNSPTTEKAAPKKKKTAARKRTRQQEIDHSIETGTVPARYRSSVPKQYQRYIPFAKQ